MSTDSIILNVKKGDFDHQLPKEERWQRQAESSLIKALTNTAESAKTYRAKRREDKDYLQALHDAIFVAAPRGSGKTIFLRNAQDVWQEFKKTDSKAPKLHFCREIDPTLLVNKDNFANVVIAHFYNEVERKSQQSADKRSLEKADQFYQSLSQLADALGQSEYRGDEMSGIDRIVSYRSGIQLERYFHDFVEHCIEILGVDAIVLPIDDVDMALGRAFEVLDVVRRLLACPFVIPLVSGDRELFQPIIKEHFIYGGGANKQRALLSKAEALSLTDAYLTKLFPISLRVSLQPLSELKPRLNVKEKEKEEEGSASLSAKEYFTLLESLICPFVNGQEKSKDWPEPENPREMGQLCAHFPPSRLRQVATAKDDAFWYAYQCLAEARHHGSAYLIAKAEQSLIAMRRAQTIEFPIRELELFNVLKQARATPTEWKEKDYFGETMIALNALLEKPTTDSFWSGFLVALQTRKYVLRSMPPIDLYIPQLVVVQAEVKLANRSDDPSERQRAGLLLDIYTHHAYYGTAQNTTAQIFFGRGFEILATSLLLAEKDKDTGTRETREKCWSIFLQTVLTTPPHHSMHAIAPTKTQIEDDGSADYDDDTSTAAQNRISQCNYFAGKIVNWEIEFWDILKKAQGKGLTTLLICVFNKVFTQLYMMRRIARKNLEDDCLTHIAKRFEYILINAFAVFLNPGSVVLQNIALTGIIETIQNPVKFRSADPSFRNNVHPYIDERPDNPLNRSSWKPLLVEEENALLLRAIWAHPLFDLNKGTPIIKIGVAKSSSDATGRAKNTKKSKLIDVVRVELAGMIPNTTACALLSQEEATKKLAELVDACREKGFDPDELFKYGAGPGSGSYSALKKKAQGT